MVCCMYCKVSKVDWCRCTFKFSFDLDILAFSGPATVLATFSRNWAIFSNHLVTLPVSVSMPYLRQDVDEGGGDQVKML
jgi:hypothetical protein